MQSSSYTVRGVDFSATWGLLQVTELNVTTPSTVPPSFTVTAVSNYTEGNAILTVATNETATVYYMVLLGQATSIPTASQVCAPAACSNIAVVEEYTNAHCTPCYVGHTAMPATCSAACLVNMLLYTRHITCTTLRIHPVMQALLPGSRQPVLTLDIMQPNPYVDTLRPVCTYHVQRPMCLHANE